MYKIKLYSLYTGPIQTQRMLPIHFCSTNTRVLLFRVCVAKACFTKVATLYVTRNCHQIQLWRNKNFSPLIICKSAENFLWFHVRKTPHSHYGNTAPHHLPQLCLRVHLKMDLKIAFYRNVSVPQ